MLEGQLLSEYHGNSPLLQDVHGYLEGFVPKYVEALHDFAVETKDKFRDADGPAGWGVYAHGNLLTPELFTGRNLCVLGNDTFIAALIDRFPQIEYQVGISDMDRYGAIWQRPKLIKGLGHGLYRETVQHYWTHLAVKEDLKQNREGEEAVLDETAKQLDPDAPFVRMSPDMSAYRKGSHSYETIAEPFDVVALWETTANNLRLNKKQMSALNHLLTLGVKR